MERDIHGGSLGLASHLRNGALGAPLPRDLRCASGKRAAHIIGNIFRQGCACINRPAAEIERVDVSLQAIKAGFRESNSAPSEPSQMLEFAGVELDRCQTAGERLVKPRLDSLVKDCIELAAS